MPESFEQNEDSKTEEATPYKKEEVRKKGQVAQSKEIGTAAILLATTLLFYFYGGTFFEQIIAITRSMFMKIETFNLTDSNLVNLLMEGLRGMFMVLAPVLILCMVIGLLANVLQTGVVFTSETMKINFEKINPVSGFKKLFSLRSGVEALKAVLKLVIIGSVVYLVVRGEVASSVLLMDQSVNEIIKFIGIAIFKTVIYVAFLMVVLAILDFLYQKLRHEKEIRMTKQEVKEEIKEREGDPNVKARIRSLQRQMATKRMLQDVPRAQVVITNPTHIAVAVQYNREMKAPKVVAKGADYLAEKIRKIAREHDIPFVENKSLARTLYKNVKVGQCVPENLYNAVAEVLAYVMKVRNKFSDMLKDEENETSSGEIPAT